MKVLSLIATSIVAMLVVFSTTAYASWKKSALGDNTSQPRSAIISSASKQRVRTTRSASASTRKPRASRSQTASNRSTRPNRPQTGSGRTLNGLASFYWQPQRVASGGWFNPNALTAAHKSLPFGTRVRVTNLRNGRSVVVSINDRGPFIAGRIIDLSKRAAIVVGMQNAGVVPVRVEVL